MGINLRTAAAGEKGKVLLNGGGLKDASDSLGMRQRRKHFGTREGRKGGKSAKKATGEERFSPPAPKKGIRAVGERLHPKRRRN